jgi:hypothetical protein
MLDYVGLIFGLGLYYGRFSDKVFTGRRQLRRPRIWFKNVKIAKDESETMMRTSL